MNIQLKVLGEVGIVSQILLGSRNNTGVVDRSVRLFVIVVKVGFFSILFFFKITSFSFLSPTNSNRNTRATRARLTFQT